MLYSMSFPNVALFGLLNAENEVGELRSLLKLRSKKGDSYSKSKISNVAAGSL